MATYNKGVLGEFSGKVGPVVGSTWRNKPVLRSLPRKSSTPPSAKQLDSRKKFGAVSAFLAPLGELIEKTYLGNFEHSTRRGAAISYYCEKVAVRTVDGYKMDYSQLLLSAGMLKGILGDSVHIEPDQTLVIQWENNGSAIKAEETDWLSVVLYSPALHEFFIVENAAQRVDQQLEIEVPSPLRAEPLHVYVFFSELKKDGSLADVSCTDYLGEVFGV